MFNFLKSKPIISKQDSMFQVETYKWLLKYFGGKDFYEEAKLILPTRQYFPSKVKDPEEAAIETFEAVKKYAGMEEWPCKLVAQEEDINPVVGETLVVRDTPSSALGTFEYKGEDEVIITYNPASLSSPTQLVATFAHELAHYLTGTAIEPPPGGWDNWEFATDITATFLGFGVFMANSTFNFSQYTGSGSQGWKTTNSGYLTESEHIYALAIFLLLKSVPVDQATSCLKPNLKKLLKKAVKEIDNSNIIAELKAIKHEEPELAACQSTNL
ncbi:hypothetical protein EDC56_3720 [Sinobacterium caligoides]|uniref:Uncharacterized protein n=1 Tax=Sinobacterium caligoides TaxID=933926 RepID=A0A3N2D550_9GAMM|nr:hypothetical protein [Sinobacterium caligoides]ROR94907.1 hypothetical protein EDC56_3720 [Sinobacterium caligoides]